MNFDYIPLDKAVIDETVKEFEQNRKAVLSKVRFDKGFDNSVVGLDFLNELMIWGGSKVNIYHVAFNVAYNYLERDIESMSDDDYKMILGVVSRWAKAFKCAYDHSSSVNFSWAFRELLKEVKPLIAD
jgi:hypothetical protein